jgi:hypothetical protein
MGLGGLMRRNKGDDGATMGRRFGLESGEGAGGEAAPFAANTK